jgi:hypothetical protein
MGAVVALAGGARAGRALVATKFARLRVSMAKGRKTRRRGGRLVRLTLRKPRLSLRRKKPAPKELRPIRMVTTDDYVPAARRTRRFLLPEYKVNQ